MNTECLSERVSELENEWVFYSKSMTQTYYRKAKSEKRKAKNEKRKAKNKKNLDFDQMKVCIWYELFDWRKTLTHSLTF